MNLTTDYLVRAVAQALQKDVLPALEAKSPAAGNLRACLMLLATIEDRVRYEGAALFDTNKCLRGVFTRLAADPILGRETDMAQQVMRTLEASPPRTAFVSTDEMFRENLTYQTLLCNIIALAHERRSQWQPEGYASVSREIAIAVEALGKLDETLIQHASQLTPV